MLFGSSHVQTSPVNVWAPLVGADAVVAHPARRTRIAAVVRAFMAHLRSRGTAVRRSRAQEHTNAVPGRAVAHFAAGAGAGRVAGYRVLRTRVDNTPHHP